MQHLDLSVFAWEAHRRGMTYGQLVSSGMVLDAASIIADYKQQFGTAAPGPKPRKCKKRPGPKGSEYLERMRMYLAGFTDVQIAAAVGVSRGAIWEWRQRHHLPAQKDRPAADCPASTEGSEAHGNM